MRLRIKRREKISFHRMQRTQIGADSPFSHLGDGGCRHEIECNSQSDRSKSSRCGTHNDDGKEPRFSNAQELLAIVSLNLFAQVAFDKLSDLSIGESLLQLYHNLRPPFGLRLWVLRCSLLNRK